MNSMALALDAQMFLRLLTAVVLGMLAGYGREPAGTPTSVQTHCVVSMIVATQNPSVRIKRNW